MFLCHKHSCIPTTYISESATNIGLLYVNFARGKALVSVDRQQSTHTRPMSKGGSRLQTQVSSPKEKPEDWMVRWKTRSERETVC